MSLRCRSPTREAACLLLALLHACRPGTPPSSTVFADSSGIRIATAPAADFPLPWQVVRDFTIGGPDGAAAPSFHDVGRAVRADGAGRIYVLDRGNHRVVVFDSTGQYLGLRGARGDGPGELGNPVALVVEPDGFVRVFDASKRAFVQFSAGGAEAGLLPAHFFGGEEISLHQGRILHTRGRSGNGAAPPTRDLIAYGEGADTLIVASREGAVGTAVRFPGCPVQFPSLPPFLEGRIHWHSSGDRLLVQPSDAYRIEAYSDGGLLLIVQRPLPPVVVDEELAILAAEEEFGAEGFVVTFPTGRCAVSPEDMVEARGWVSTASPITDLRGAPDGSIWVHRRTAVGERPIDVFTSQGDYLGTLPEDTPFPDAFVGEDRYAVVERDDNGVERVSVYAMRRPPPAQQEDP